VHRAEPEWFADDVTTSLENWRMQIECVELWAAIDKISDSSSGTQFDAEIVELFTRFAVHDLSEVSQIAVPLSSK
jgi:hypothetical protein